MLVYSVWGEVCTCAIESRKFFPVANAGIVALPSKDPCGKAADLTIYVPGPRMPRQGNAAI